MKAITIITIFLVSLMAPSFAGAKRTPIKNLGKETVRVKCKKDFKVATFKSFVVLKGYRMTGPSRTDRVFKVTSVTYKFLQKGLIGGHNNIGDENDIFVGSNWNIKRYHSKTDLEQSSLGATYSTNFSVPRNKKARVKVIFDLSRLPDISCTKGFQVA